MIVVCSSANSGFIRYNKILNARAHFLQKALRKEDMTKQSTLKVEAWLEVLHLDLLLLTRNDVTRIFQWAPFSVHLLFCVCRIPWRQYRLHSKWRQVLDRFCLPTCMTKTEIYHNYVENMRDAGVKEISMPTFSRMWRKNLIPKVQFWAYNENDNSTRWLFHHHTYT